MIEGISGREVAVIGTASHRIRCSLGAGLALLLILLLVGATPASGARATLVRDIVAGSAPSRANQLTDVDDTLFFYADDGIHGRELWRSDGTRAGTRFVRDIRPGEAGSAPRFDVGYLTSVTGVLYFTADDGIHGEELWRSDGTRAGTQLVSDIMPGSRGSYPVGLTRVGDTLFFSARTGALGYELWRSDGGEAGTTLVSDIYSGPDWGSPGRLTNVDGTLFFTADDGIHGGYELWRSDGTEPGTEIVRDLRPESGPGFFGSEPTRLTNVGGTLFFYADDADHGDELWRSDGTETGTTLVSDINPGRRSSSTNLSNIGALRNVGGTLYFAASDGTRGLELWRSDGTEAGTRLVRDLKVGKRGSWPNYLTTVAGTIFFQANVRGFEEELWRSDGTRAGTRRIRDICPGRGESYPYQLTNVKRTLLFAADDCSHGEELWRSAGTRAGTRLVRDIYPGPRGSRPRKLTNVGGKLFFIAGEARHGRELWKSVP